MKKILLGITLTAVLTGCGGPITLNGKKPADIAFQWTQDDLNGKYIAQYHLLTKQAQKQSQYVLKDFQPSHKNRKLKNYYMKRWTDDNTSYFFETQYYDPGDHRYFTDWIHIVKTPNGWRSTDMLLRPKDLPPNLEQMPSTVLKGMHYHE